MARVFLSYSSDQREFADQINLSLVSRGHDVFFDRDDLPDGATFERQIEEGVKRSDILLFLISPASVQDGRYTLTELKYARAKWPTPDGRVLPVMVEPTSFDDVPSYLKAVTVLEPEGSASAEIASTVDEMAKALRRKGRGLRVALAALVVAGLSAGALNIDRLLGLMPGEEAGETIVAVSADQCFGPQLYDAVAAGNLSYSEAKSLGQMCANELLPAVSAGDPAADQNEAFAEDFAAAATSDSESERRAAATITRGDAGNAVDSFFALARSATDDEVKARHYRSAASLAFQSEPSRAIEAFEQVVALEPDDLGSWTGLGQLYRAVGEQDKAGRVAEEMERRAGGGGLDWKANVLLEEARRQMSIGNLDAGKQKLIESRQVFGQTGNRWGVAQSLLAEGELLMMMGDLIGAKRVSEDALTLAENYRFLDVAPAAKVLIGRTLMGTFEFDAAEPLFVEAEQEFIQINNEYGAVFTANQRGLLAMNQADFVTAKTIMSEVRDDHARLGFRDGEAWAEISLGQIEQATGRIEAARSAFRKSEAIFSEIGNPMGQASAIMADATVVGMQGRQDQALVRFQEAREIGRNAGVYPLEAQALMGSAYIHRVQGDQDRAVRDYERGLELYDLSNNALGSLWALEQLGQMAAASQETSQARAYWTRALEISREQGIDDATQRLQFELSRL